MLNIFVFTTISGKIHVSEATREALREQGKGDWCVARPDKISAKGKGLMQTVSYTKYNEMLRFCDLKFLTTLSFECSILWKWYHPKTDRIFPLLVPR